MAKTKYKKEAHIALLASITKDMAKPRMAESAREEDVNQTTRQKLEKLP